MRYANANINFNNTSTINVIVTQNTTNKAANIEFNGIFTQGGTNAVTRSIQTKLREEWISVKDFGAVGDGNANDTIAVQDAINYANTLGGGVVYFPEGTYNLAILYYRPGITFQGEGGNSKLFKIPATVSFARMFTVENGALYDSTVDSKPVIWRDLYFDGNSSNQTPYANYEKEHDHMIFLVGGNSNPGRLRAMIRNCVFENTVADAVSVYHNVNLEISDCMFRNCFRGSLVSTGGWVIINATNINAVGSGDQLSRIDIETDGAGYNGSNAANLTFSNIFTQYGFDLTGADVTAYWDNIVTEQGSLPGSGSPSRPFGVTLGGFGNTGDVVITNSKLVFGEQDGSGNRIYQPKSLKLENCQLIHRRDPATSGAKEYGQRIYWGANNLVIFQDCEIICDNTVQSADTANGITSLNNSIAANNLLVIDSCKFIGSANGFDTAIYLRGGNTVIRDTTVDAVTPIYQQNFISEGAFSTTGWDLTIDNMETTKRAQKWMHIVSTDSAAFITHKNTYANATNANVTTDSGYSTVNFRGSKLLQGSAAPTTTTQGFPNDRFILNTPGTETLEWVHVGYSGSDNVWRSVANDAFNQANLAYSSSNAAANLVAVYANNSLRYANANVNFNNSASINVSVTQNTTNKAANVEFTANQSSITALGLTASVGIGTASPGYKLTVLDSVNVVSRFKGTGGICQVEIVNDVDKGFVFGVYKSDYSAGSNFSVGANGAYFGTVSGYPFAVGTIDAQPLYLGTNNTERMRILSDGTIKFTAVYGTTVGATNRDLFIDDTGLIGYVSSIRESKKNIESLSDVSWLLDLNPVKFNRRKKDENKDYTEETYSETEYGLIAEEVEVTAPELCFYDVIEENDEKKNELRGVHYSKLITPILKLVQDQQKEIANLKSEIEILKQR